MSVELISDILETYRSDLILLDSFIAFNETRIKSNIVKVELEKLKEHINEKIDKYETLLKEA